jgi:predicted  nucleic acid-binding Zn-ribbon protein
MAENFLKLTEENIRLNEKGLALHEDMESADRVAASRSQMELPAELGNFLEELKQDTAAINAELVSLKQDLKQDRSTFVSLEKSFKEGVVSLQKAASITPPRVQTENVGLKNALEEFNKGSEAINAELAALKDDRQVFDSLKKSIEGVVSAAREAGPAMTPQTQAESGDLAKSLDEFRRGTETMSAELIALKQEICSIHNFRDEIKVELQELLKSHFDDIDAKLSKAAPVAAPAAGEKKAQLLAAVIEKEPAGLKEDASLPDFKEEDETPGDDELEFLSEDDILDVDKLRDVFQSVLNSSISDTSDSREDNDDVSADLLFLDDSLFEDEHEPEVTFSLEEKSAGTKFQKTETT